MRIVLGVIFLVHGISKFQMSLGNVSGFFQSVGLPGWVAYVTAFVEVIGGLLMILGLFTRYVSIAFGVVMLGAIFTLKLQNGLTGDGQASGYEFELVLLVVSAYFALNGEQGYSVDRALKLKKAA
jgi:uncharacterized membrane protein YphA (DoxX/SURF4 family)